jgi:hypothetical protein
MNPIISNSEETIESFIKNSIIMNNNINLLNIFESIQELQRIMSVKSNKLFINIDTGRPMSLSKHITMIRKEMQYHHSILHIH